MRAIDKPEKQRHTRTPSLERSGLVAFLGTQPDVIAAYLFGSLAQGRATSSSDVDIAVLLSPADPESVWERQLQLMGEIERFVHGQVEVVILDTAPPILQDQVLRYGRLLYERDRRARVTFEVQAGKSYADLKPMTRFFARALFREIKEVGLGGRRRRRAGATLVPAE
jgi:predicted nucleotidyltransferase